MKILTPSNAAFLPNGSGGENPNASISVTVNGTATADLVVGAYEIGPLPETGPYYMILFVQTTNATASAGSLDVFVTYNSGSGVLNTTMNLTLDNASGDFFLASVDDLSVTLNYTISGFGIGSTDYKIIAAAIKMF